MVALCVQRHDTREDGLAPIAALRVLGDDTRADLHLLAEAEDPSEDGPTGHAALELVDLRTGLVHVEGTDDDQAGIGGEVADRDGDALDNVLVDGVDVVLELCRYGDDWRQLRDGT